MLRTQIYLPERHVRLLKKKATEEETSVSELIRRAVQEQVVRGERVGAGKKPENIGKWLRSIAHEVTFKGPKDLAKNLDRYLYGEDAI